jgi:hypothetical protein
MNAGRLVIALGALIGIAGLFVFGRHVWTATAPQAEPSGIAIRSEIVIIYAPKALIDFAKANAEITTNDELVRLIREAQLKVWFATVTRLHQANGFFTDLPIWYRPGERPECFEDAKSALRILAGDRRGPGIMAYRNARTEVIEDAMMEIKPVDGLRQLLTR